MVILRLARIKHWVKNIFIFIPWIFTPNSHNLDSFLIVSLGFLAFCLLSSSVYILNDIIDINADRLHPVKKSRPLASGDISLSFAGLIIIAILLSAAFICLFIPIKFLFVLGLYLIINILYCLYTKNISILDVMSIASGFVLRVIGGALILDVTASTWLLLCTGFIALFIAFAKRRDDIVHDLGTSHRKSLKGYNYIFLDIAITVCLTSVLLFYSIYTTEQAFLNHGLSLTIPFVVMGVFRYMQITFVEKRSGNPVDIVTKDKMILSALALWSITIIYLQFPSLSSIFS